LELRLQRAVQEAGCFVQHLDRWELRSVMNAIQVHVESVRREGQSRAPIPESSIEEDDAQQKGDGISARHT
jgi:hypothetical protein